MLRGFPLQEIDPFPGSPPNTRSIGRAQVDSRNGIWIGSSVFAQLMVVSNKQTDSDRPQNISGPIYKISYDNLTIILR